MTSKACQQEVVITHHLGMHTRVSAQFVQTAGQFESQVRVSKGKTEVDGKSVLGLMMLGASKGERVKIAVTGPDARDALETLCGLVGKGHRKKKGK